MLLYNHSKGENKSKSLPIKKNNNDKDSQKNQKGNTKMANKNNTNSTRFTVDFIGKKISGTKASFDKAGKGNGPIYEELAGLTAKHPNFALVIKEQTKRIVKEKETYKGMDCDFMRDYLIAERMTEALKTFKQVETFADNTKRSKYPLLKKFFLKQFTDKDGNINFDFSKAKKTVSDYRYNLALEQATESASPAILKTA